MPRAGVGIVLVTHNASMAVRVTLASIRRARNDVPAEVIVVDNASHDLERAAIASAVARHREAGQPWTHVQLEKNLGFAGGNNVGIRRFLEDPGISHVCLLNSDVIVTDHWLDRLLEAGCRLTSAVTNKADSEQCVPVDYTLELADCLDADETLRDDAYERVRAFADAWYTAWRGHIVEAEPTFFCALMPVDVFQRVGLLDERFFPGGYEDDDFCIRMKETGENTHLSRDVFIHHWGSASFGQLPHEYFSSHARRNREYLETKHGIRWQRRPEKPFVAYGSDVAFALNRGPDAARSAFLGLYATRLAPLVEHFAREFRTIASDLAHSGLDVPPPLAEQIERVRASGDLRERWAECVAAVDRARLAAGSGAPGVEAGAAAVHDMADRVHDLVDCNFGMHELMHPPRPEVAVAEAGSPIVTSNAVPLSRRPIERLRRGARQAWHGLKWWVGFRGIVFFGGYPYPERQSDGYFQRIQQVDRLFADQWRVYVESDELRGRGRWLDRPENQVIVLRILGSRRRRLVARLLAVAAALRCGRVYYHSVLRMHDNRLGRLMHVPWMTKVFDVHGVVPEEFRFHHDYYSAVLYEAEEATAVRKCDMVVVVTDAMHRYLQQKYRSALRGRVVAFPMFPVIQPSTAARPYVDGKPVVVYAGGLHKWQQVPKMVDAIVRTSHTCVHRFYCPDPAQVKALLPDRLRDVVEVDTRTQEQMAEIYPQCHYGFILREDNIVNNVACPTKLVEYLATGVVPIVDSEAVGDFRELGMHAVTLPDFLAGRLPDEATRQQFAVANFALFEKLRDVRRDGARAIHACLSDSPRRPLRQRLRAAVARTLPADTAAGRLSRQAWAAIRPRRAPVPRLPTQSPLAEAAVPPAESGSCEQPCDVLVQVANFEAGGLETAALDLSAALRERGAKVTLQVLGLAGPAVEHAQAMGMPVRIGLPAPGDYRSVVDRLKPRVVLTHYSIHGAETYRQAGVPFVQVLHNIYMWFDAVQLAEFKAAAQLTSLFIAVSEDVRRYSVARLGVPESRCVVIPGGVDMTPLDPEVAVRHRAELRKQLGIGAEEFVFLSVGAVNHQKNHLGEVRAFARIAPQCPRARLVILGPPYEPALLEELHRFIASRALADQVFYAGAALSAVPYFAMADAFVSASFFEGGPLTLLEAVRAKLPVVMTRVGLATHFEGLPGFEIVDPPFDLLQFHGRIWEMVSTPAFEERFGAAMVRVCRNPRPPEVPPALLASMDRRHIYERYTRLILDVAAGRGVPPGFEADCWTARLTARTLDDAAG